MQDRGGQVTEIHSERKASDKGRKGEDSIQSPGARVTLKVLFLKETQGEMCSYL